MTTTVMPRCFVIQPFDAGPFDARYEQVLDPAVRAAGVEPYRVDRDPSSTIPIETIERNIRAADYCLADISTENPNVWYEVGYGFSCGKDVILICTKDRTTFPFDVRHRGILRYGTHAPSDFTKLGTDIKARLEALKATEKRIHDVSLLKPTEGLTTHEMTALVILLGSSFESGSMSPGELRKEMERAYVNGAGTALAVKLLTRKGYVIVGHDHDSFGELYDVLIITESGMEWCLANQAKLNLKFDPPPPPRRPGTVQASVSRRVQLPASPGEDDDITI